MNTIVLLDTRVDHKEIIVNAVSDTTHIFTIEPTTYVDELIDNTDICFSSIESIGLCYHYKGIGSPFFNKTLDDHNKYYSSELLRLFEHWNAHNAGEKHIDLLTCNPFITSIHEQEFEYAKSEYNIQTHYSLNDTGTVPNGDWIMETSGRDTKLIYFTDAITQYTYRLGFSHFIIQPNPDSSNMHTEENYSATYDSNNKTGSYINKAITYHPKQIIKQADIDILNTFEGSLYFNTKVVEFQGDITFNQLSIVIDWSNYTGDIDDGSTDNLIKIYSDSSNITITSNIGSFLRLYTTNAHNFNSFTVTIQNLKLIYTDPYIENFGGIIEEYDSNHHGTVQIQNSEITLPSTTTHSTNSEIEISGIIKSGSFNNSSNVNLIGNVVNFNSLQLESYANRIEVNGLIGSNSFNNTPYVQYSNTIDICQNNIDLQNLTTGKPYVQTYVNGIMSSNCMLYSVATIRILSNQVNLGNITTSSTYYHLSGTYNFNSDKTNAISLESNTITAGTIDAPNALPLSSNYIDGLLYNGTLSPSLDTNAPNTSATPTFKHYLRQELNDIDINRNETTTYYGAHIQGMLYYSGLNNTYVEINALVADDANIAFDNSYVSSVTYNYDTNGDFETMVVIPQNGKYNETLETTLEYMKDPSRKTVVEPDTSISSNNRFSRYKVTK